MRKLKEKLRTNLENMRPVVTANGKYPAAFNTPIIYDQVIMNSFIYRAIIGCYVRCYVRKTSPVIIISGIKYLAYKRNCSYQNPSKIKSFCPQKGFVNFGRCQKGFVKIVATNRSV